MSREKPSAARKPARPAEAVPLGESLFAFAAGGWLGLCVVKFGNPVIFDQTISAPSDLGGFVFFPWPVAWGYLLLAGVLCWAVRFARPVFNSGHWPIAAAGVWFFWQFISHGRSLDPRLSGPTLWHFGSCVLALLLGWWALSRARNLRWFWIPVLIGFTYVLIGGFDQQHGGLESTRREFYKQDNWQMYPKEFLLKIQSERIFSTLVYPNALAGLILLMLPISLWKTWELTQPWPRVGRGVALGMLAYLGAGCLFWTGSKGGWLVGMVMGLGLILHLGLPRRWKLAIITLSLALGLTVFFVRFSAYFQKGATSVGARLDYWQAALQTAKEHPILGTGPGTFSAAYRKIKPPEAEMAKLTHNDYLEQASDSGLAGFVSFGAFVFGSMVILYRRRPAGDWTYFILWLGLLGWTLQAFIEFGLYIPAIAWPAFLFIGLLWAKAEPAYFTKP